MKLPSRAGWAGIILGLLIVVGLNAKVGGERLPLDLELDIGQSTANSQLQVYYDTGSGFQEAGSVTRPIAASSAPQALTFALPDQPVRAIRIDPLMTEGVVVITAAKTLTRSSRREDRRLDLRRMTPLLEIDRLHIQPDTGALEITTTPHSTDSQCQLVPDEPITAGRQTGFELFLWLLPFDLSLLFTLALAVFVFWVSTGKLPWQWWHSWDGRPRALRGWRRAGVGLASAALMLYAWLLMLNLGRSPLVPATEPSWVAVMTYAIAHRWQFGKDFILTYGPTMPLMMCSYIGSIDTVVFVGRLVCKTWTFVLFLWLGGRLPWKRCWVFWLVSLALVGGLDEQAAFSLSLVAAGLLFARGGRSDRWLLAPSLIYVVTVALIKINFLLYALLMLGAVVLDRFWQRRWLAGLWPAVLFVGGFCVEWSLLGQSLRNVPLYLRGSFEIVDGFAQAMSLPPDPQVLLLGLGVAAAAVVQLVLLLLRPWRPHWAGLPMAGLLAAGLLLAWKGGFARADGHVMDWLTYAVVSVAMAPAFFPDGSHRVRPWLDWTCLAVALVAGWLGLQKSNPEAGRQIVAIFEGRSLSSLQVLLHPRDTARAEKQVIVQNRRTYELPRIRALVGEHTVDVFCDEQAIAILNGLNYRPRPIFLGYSTYTPWLMDLDVAFYSSRQAPEYVLFKLQSIDNRLPTLQNAPLLLMLAERYEPVLTEKGYVLFRRRVQPTGADALAAFPLLAQGDVAFGDPLPLPAEGAVWCELEVQETLFGKLLRFFYQQPPLELLVTTREGGVGEFRLVPRLASSGFLITPLPATDDDFLHWLSGRPVTVIRSICLEKSAPLARTFSSTVHYRFYRAPSPALSK